MTSRMIIITDRAKALNRIEAALPQKFVAALPSRSDVRLNVILDYVATALEKRKPAAPPTEETPPPAVEEVEPAK